jgi:hypothetical protein
MLTVLMVTVAASVQMGSDTEPIDYDAVYRLKDEGFQRSQVMEIASYLTDVYGPRLTGSPNIRAAGDWAVQKLTEWGAVNARLENWGTFGRGWVNTYFAGNVVTPRPWPIIGVPKAWTPGTQGPITAEAIYAPLESEKDFAAWKGRLKGKIVLATPMREVKPDFEPLAQRFTQKDLEDLEQVDPRSEQRHRDLSRYAFSRKVLEFLAGESPAAIFEPSRRGDGGTVFAQQGGPYNPNQPPPPGPYSLPWPATIPTQVVLAVEHYDRLARTLEKKVPVTIDLNVRNTFTENEPGFNVLAEIPGRDKADEIVMLGAHFDSWHAATGATDNAAGSAVMLEAMRILKASGVVLRRTVRLALWTGEEQGLLGSRAYVKATIADRETMQLRPDHGRISAYFNVDNGTGAIRGVYLQGNEAVAPIFTEWMKPFASLGMTTLTLQKTDGTDHLSFDDVGIPGFQFIQDPLEYETRTHHSNMDDYDRLQADDMMKNAVIVASFVYHAANREAKLPRKPLPKPQPERLPHAVTTTR